MTPVLVHGSLLHLLFNMYFLYLVGPLVEQLYGSARFVLLYVLTAAAGSAASFLFGGPAPSVGASGAIFGLCGVLLAVSAVHRPVLDRRGRALMSQIGGPRRAQPRHRLRVRRARWRNRQRRPRRRAAGGALAGLRPAADPGDARLVLAAARGAAEQPRATVARGRDVRRCRSAPGGPRPPPGRGRRGGRRGRGRPRWLLRFAERIAAVHATGGARRAAPPFAMSESREHRSPRGAILRAWSSTSTSPAATAPSRAATRGSTAGSSPAVTSTGHLLPAQLPGHHAAGRARPLLPDGRRGAGGRLPGLQALHPRRGARARPPGT